MTTRNKDLLDKSSKICNNIYVVSTNNFVLPYTQEEVIRIFSGIITSSFLCYYRTWVRIFQHEIYSTF